MTFLLCKFGLSQGYRGQVKMHAVGFLNSEKRPTPTFPRTQNGFQFTYLLIVFQRDLLTR